MRSLNMKMVRKAELQRGGGAVGFENYSETIFLIAKQKYIFVTPIRTVTARWF